MSEIATNFDLPCNGCGKKITDNVPFGTISVGHEIFENGAVTIYESTLSVIFCEECSKNIDFSVGSNLPTLINVVGADFMKLFEPKQLHS